MPSKCQASDSDITQIHPLSSFGKKNNATTISGDHKIMPNLFLAKIYHATLLRFWTCTFFNLYTPNISLPDINWEGVAFWPLANRIHHFTHVLCALFVAQVSILHMLQQGESTSNKNKPICLVTSIMSILSLSRLPKTALNPLVNPS